MQQAYKSPYPAAERHRERGGTLGTVLAIIGGLVLACTLVTLAALWYVSRYIKVEVSRTPGAKQVQIETPFGGLTVRKAEDVAQELKLPIYPGATPDEDSASVKLWMGTEEAKGGFDLTIAQFSSDDALEKIDAWYREQLGSDYKREAGRLEGTRGDKRPRRSRGGIHIRADRAGVVYLRETDERVRGVALEPRWGRVRIALFDVWTAGEQ